MQVNLTEIYVQLWHKDMYTGYGKRVNIWIHDMVICKDKTNMVTKQSQRVDNSHQDESPSL